MLILFGGDLDCPKGGANDFVCSSGDLIMLEELGGKLLNGKYLHYSEVDWWHIFDTTKGIIVSDGCCW